MARKVSHKPMTEVRVFATEVEAPENESESEEQEHEPDTKENKNDTTENPTEEEEVASECESVSTVGYSRAEDKNELDKSDNEERIKKSSPLIKKKLRSVRKSQRNKMQMINPLRKRHKPVNP